VNVHVLTNNSSWPFFHPTYCLVWLQYIILSIGSSGANIFFSGLRRPSSKNSSITLPSVVRYSYNTGIKYKSVKRNNYIMCSFNQETPCDLLKDWHVTCDIGIETGSIHPLNTHTFGNYFQMPWKLTRGSQEPVSFTWL